MEWTPSVLPERKRRPLPEHDETIDALSDAQRAFVAASCARRAELELRGAASFAIVTSALIALRAPAAIVALSSRAITEELLHSEVYLYAASRYAGTRMPAPEVRPVEVPRFPGASDEQHHVLHVVGMCSVNETMACEFLRVCMEGCVGPLLRSALREVLADEVDHARIGWAWLAAQSGARRQGLGGWVRPLVQTQWRGWRAQIDGLPDEALPEHGCPSASAIDAAGLGAIRDLVIPGFAHLGIDTADARAWLAAVTDQTPHQPPPR